MRKKRFKSLSQRQALTGRLFVYPWLIGFLIFFATPFIQSLVFAFSELDLTPFGLKLTFIGFKNFIKALQEDPTFIQYLTLEVSNTIVNIPLILMFSLFIAILLNQKFKGRALVRAIFFLPVVVMSGALLYVLESYTMEQFYIGAQTGMAMSNSPFVRGIDFRMLLIQITGNIPFVRPLIDAINRIYEIIWKSGVQILIFLAGLQSIPHSLYEVASVEGATPWESFWKITFPLLSPIILVNVVYTVIDSFTDYSNDVLRYILEVAFRRLQHGYSSAIAWIYFLILGIILVLLVIFISKRVFYMSE
ncbi:MAG: sugar ABC transporter permease [Dictyoglomus sp.]|nr:sugar ABC transporter permease [Dictyoglomus sp.]MDW8188233.1 sugar ABC transporter permease [Dictyoglomus sp.]